MKPLKLYISQRTEVIQKNLTQWILLQAYVPISLNKNEQMVRYLGFYSNVCRGRRNKQGIAESEYVIEGEEYNKGANKSWARLIKKIYEVDPLVCPKCGGNMRIIAFIEDYKVVKKILDWLGIYEFKRDKPPPKTLAAADSFDDYSHNDYIDTDYIDF